MDCTRQVTLAVVAKENPNLSVNGESGSRLLSASGSVIPWDHLWNPLYQPMNEEGGNVVIIREV